MTPVFTRKTQISRDNEFYYGVRDILDIMDSIISAPFAAADDDSCCCYCFSCVAAYWFCHSERRRAPVACSAGGFCRVLSWLLVLSVLICVELGWGFCVCTPLSLNINISIYL